MQRTRKIYGNRKKNGMGERVKGKGRKDGRKEISKKIWQNEGRREEKHGSGIGDDK